MNIKEIFDKYTVDWEGKIEEDEWYFEKFRSSCIEKMSSDEAFNAIPDLIKITLSGEYSYPTIERLQNLLTAIRASSTTQLSDAMKKSIEKLKQCDSDTYFQSKINEIKKWYRL